MSAQTNVMLGICSTYPNSCASRFVQKLDMIGLSVVNRLQKAVAAALA